MVGRAGADDKDDFRNSRLRALVAETLKLCAKAATLAPGASEPLVLQTWAHMVAGNVTAALHLCDAERLLAPAGAGGQDGCSRGKTAAGAPAAATPLHAALPQSPELWVICGRALHLCGRTSDARRVLRLAIACKLAVRTPVPLPIPRLASVTGLPGSLLPGAPRSANTLSGLTTRDEQRLVRECRYEISLMDKLAAALQSAHNLRAQAKFERLIQVFAPMCAAMLSVYNGWVLEGQGEHVIEARCGRS